MGIFAKHSCSELFEEEILRRRYPVLIVVVFVLLAVLPCYAYGDPSGGALFQVLMPILAALWGMWMIFANNVRRRGRDLLRKWRGKTAAEAGFAESPLPEPSSPEENARET
jgi:hypothetical protein